MTTTDKQYRYGNAEPMTATRGDPRGHATEHATRTVLELIEPEQTSTVLRIYTVPAVAEDLVGLILDVSDGATVLRASGYWRDPAGNILSERAAVIETVLDTRHAETVKRYAQSMGAKFGESCVLITSAVVRAEVRDCR